MQNDLPEQTPHEEKKAARRFVWILIANLFSLGHVLTKVMDPLWAGFVCIVFVVGVTLLIKAWGQRLPVVTDPILLRERGLKNMRILFYSGLLILAAIWSANFLVF